MMNQGTEILSPATYLRKAGWLFEESNITKWTPEENKRFENALALFDKDAPDRWYKVAAILPGKTVNDVIKKYNELVEDVSDIEAGLIPIPGDTSSSFTLEQVNDQVYDGPEQFFGPGGKRRLSAGSSDPVRKKGVPWTEEEHRQFLLGLQKYGKGDWRNISRNFVTTRTPTQVASHAQKYFIRQLSGGKDNRRSSIHDITIASVTETKSPSPEEQRPPRSPDKSATVMQQQHHSNMNSITNALYNHNLQNHGPEKANEMQNNCLDKTHLHGTPLFDARLHEHNLQNITSHGLQLGQYNMFHQLQSTQRQ